MIPNLLPICRAYRKATDDHLNELYGCSFEQILWPHFDDRTIFVQSHSQTINKIPTIAMFYPNGKDLEFAVCYFWHIVNYLHYPHAKEKLLDSGFQNIHQRDQFLSILSTIQGRSQIRDYESSIVKAMLEEDQVIHRNASCLKPTSPSFFILYLPDISKNLVYTVPIVSNDSVPEGKCFLKTVILKEKTTP